ncbi:amidase domain-containing protein [Neobacillus sp. PS3-34]|uniref:amidase domain-containing protein n=1 Tax=Neobacillus sp. PS3-34 TaxID=3070678 RepID=UPI0027E090AC|nr:amidase domain-containing protein [Neobacillus sp. PS3-34]WML49811.1 amidase domain-containing protein [Neobacillus sp. PS3-34]
MRSQLQEFLEKRVQQYVSQPRGIESPCQKAEKKKEAHLKRAAEIVKTKASGKILKRIEEGEFSKAIYQVHFQYLIKQKDLLYIEEEIELREAKFYKGVLVEDEEVKRQEKVVEGADLALSEFIDVSERLAYQYNRLKAVQYAERWWNDYNPAYKRFENDCTSFISQCLHNGGSPMRGYPSRASGWWLKRNNYSYSWAVANSLRLYLANSKSGLRASEVRSPEQLTLGDVICYDFQGDGRFDHNTIVTGKDANGMPLVNAHTYNSRMRYWAYEDSTAYTPKIKYKFYSIFDGN